jgi:hypothetical protein
MTNIDVQFTDSASTAILSVFAGPQDPTAYPNQANIPSSDARYEAWYAALPAITTWKGGFVVPGT